MVSLVVSAQLKILDDATLNQTLYATSLVTYKIQVEQRARNIKRKQRARLTLTHKKKAECSATQGVTKKNNEDANFAMRIVTGAREFEHITPYLKDLHWFPVAMQLEVRDIRADRISRELRFCTIYTGCSRLM